MERGSCGGAKGFWGVRIGGATDAGSTGGRSRDAEGSGSAENGADVAGVLNTGEDDEKRS